MRSIWKGHISFSLVMIPIRLYSASETSERISFNQLHKKDLGRIGYEKKCKLCGEAVSGPEIIKGFEYSKDKYVVVEDSDFENIKLTSTKVIEIEGFIKSSDVSPMLYDAPYFVGPDNDKAVKPYNLLIETMKEKNKIAVGRVILRDREDVVLISPHDKGLVLFKIRYPSEVRNMNEVPLIAEAKINKSELDLAKSLVDSMSVKLQDIATEDRYHQAVKEMIDAKIEGKQVEEPEAVRTAPVIDLMAALKQSLEKSGVEKKPMKKAASSGKKTTAKRKQAQ